MNNSFLLCALLVATCILTPMSIRDISDETNGTGESAMRWTETTIERPLSAGLLAYPFADFIKNLYEKDWLTKDTMEDNKHNRYDDMKSFVEDFFQIFLRKSNLECPTTFLQEQAGSKDETFEACADIHGVWAEASGVTHTISQHKCAWTGVIHGQGDSSGTVNATHVYMNPGWIGELRNNNNNMLMGRDGTTWTKQVAPTDFRIATYNLLYQSLFEKGYREKFLDQSWTDESPLFTNPSPLSEEKRAKKWKLLLAPKDAEADIFLLQEVSKRAFADLLPSEFPFYTGIFLQKDPHRDGVAVFWDTRKWTMVDYITRALRQPNLRDISGFTGKGDRESLSEDLGWPQRALIVKLRHIETSQAIVVASTHLGAERATPGKILRAAQLAEVDTLINSAFPGMPYIIGLDQNDIPDSHAYRMATTNLGLSNVYGDENLGTHSMAFEASDDGDVAHDFLYYRNGPYLTGAMVSFSRALTEAKQPWPHNHNPFSIGAPLTTKKVTEMAYAKAGSDHVPIAANFRVELKSVF